MWASAVKELLAVPEIRERYQFWFFYYPTGQPIPLSALQLREALNEAAQQHHVNRPLVLIGHSMGGILAHAQIIGLAQGKAEQMLRGVAKLPQTSAVRRSLIFEPRSDVKRVIFICTPHWGSRLATSGIAGLGIRLIRLPSWIAEELADFVEIRSADGRLATSIHGLSPDSRFLHALNQSPATSPSHSIIGEHDDVAPASSARLETALSEIAVPAGHGAFAHPEAIQEIKRILLVTENK
jgi:pimeloyl-ACP methyl ester carboxylesterase